MSPSDVAPTPPLRTFLGRTLWLHDGGIYRGLHVGRRLVGRPAAGAHVAHGGADLGVLLRADVVVRRVTPPAGRGRGRRVMVC